MLKFLVRIQKLQQILSCKHKGSNRYNKTKSWYILFLSLYKLNFCFSNSLIDAGKFLYVGLPNMTGDTYPRNVVTIDGVSFDIAKSGPNNVRQSSWQTFLETLLLTWLWYISIPSFLTYLINFLVLILLR